MIERMFGWLKENRRVVTRFDKLAKSYGAMVSLACVTRCLRQFFSDRTRQTFRAASAPDDVSWWFFILMIDTRILIVMYSITTCVWG